MRTSFRALFKKDVRLLASGKYFLMVIGFLLLYTAYINWGRLRLTEGIGVYMLEQKARREITCQLLFFELAAAGLLEIAAMLFKEKSMGVIRAHAVLPFWKDWFLLAKLAVFLLSDLCFAGLLVLWNVGLSEGAAVLPAVLVQTAILSLVMTLIGLLCALLLKDFRQFTMAYLLIVLFVAAPVFLSTMEFGWIHWHPFYHFYMGLKNACFGTPTTAPAYYIGSAGAIALLFFAVHLAFGRELGGAAGARRLAGRRMETERRACAMEGIRYQLKSVSKDPFCLMTFLLPVAAAVLLRFMGSMNLSGQPAALGGLQDILIPLLLIMAMFMGCTFNAVNMISEKENGVALVNEILPMTPSRYIWQKVTIGFLCGCLSAATTALICVRFPWQSIGLLLVLIVLSSFVAAMTGLMIGGGCDGLMTGVIYIKLLMLLFITVPVLCTLTEVSGPLDVLCYLVPSKPAFEGMLALLAGDTKAAWKSTAILAGHCVAWFGLCMFLFSRHKSKVFVTPG